MYNWNNSSRLKGFVQRPCCFESGKTNGRLLIASFLVTAALANGQVIMLGSGPNSIVNIFNTDLAVLEAGETRKDLVCSVNPGKPILGFDLKFHAGYEVTIPLKDLAGSDNMLNILFRVAPQTHRDQPIYFAQHVRVPILEDDAKGDAYLQGAFDVGEGSYHVDWLMRDRAERVCSSSWDAEASIAVKLGCRSIDSRQGSAAKSFHRSRRDPTGERRAIQGRATGPARCG